MTTNLQPLKGLPDTEWQADWESLIDYTQGVINEVETARNGQANLKASLDLKVSYSGFITHLSANNYRVTMLGNAVNPQDAVNLQTVQALISGGGSPSNIAITALNKGTGIAGQFYRVKLDGTGIEGVTLQVTDLNTGSAKEGDYVKIEGGTVITTNDLVDRLFLANI